MRLRPALTLLATLAALTLAAPAAAGTLPALAFDGGTPAEQAQVQAALGASDFDFALLPQTVTVHIAHGSDSYAAPDQVWLDADLLDSGRFAWGTVLHEFGHQVDFQLLGDADRAQLQALLGGNDWCAATASEAHDAHGCERFAETFAAAVWVSPENTATAFAPRQRFETLLDALLGVARTTASARPHARAR